jgi:hypothetical protein
VEHAASPQGDEAPETSVNRAATLADLVSWHCEAKAAQDLPAVLATIGPHPHFEVHPLGLTLSTTDAVAEFYRRMMPLFDRMRPAGSSATYGKRGDSRFQGSLGIVTYDEVIHRSDDGEEALLRSMALFQYDPASDRLKGETIFLNAAAADAFRAALGNDFGQRAGVAIAKTSD